MRRPSLSVRVRAAAAASAVVATALVIAGLAVLHVMRDSLAEQADLEAEVAAREVAAQFAVGVPVGELRLPGTGDHPTRVVGAGGRVLAASRGLRAMAGAGTGIEDMPVDQRAADPDAEGDDDDSGTGDDHGGHRGRGGDDDDPGRGEVSAEVSYGSGTATVGEKAADYRFASVEATSPGGQTATISAGGTLATETMTTTARSMLLGLPVLLLVVAVVTWLVTRRALRPVEAIRAEMAEITASRDLGRRVPVPDSGDEIAHLATTTNQTLTALEESVRRQRGFVADASHELRSPIASLRTQLEVAAAHPELLDLDGLVADTTRLQYLATDLLLLARLDAGERVPGDTVALADLVRDERDHRAGTDRIDVELDLAAAPRVRGSRTQLARVLGNLLDNAQRHAAAMITVTLRDSGGRAVLRVSDDGPGVPKADRGRIFERFVRLDTARNRDEGGAGLGLAIAREIARAHGGTLTVAPAPGGGALFELRLPAT